MINRIKQLMELKEVSVATFAELLDVNRSSFNHYFSGRSMPSLELVTKILKLYPDISSDWLVLGEGDTFRSTDTTKQLTINGTNNHPQNALEALLESQQTGEDNQIDLFAPPATAVYRPSPNNKREEEFKEPQMPYYEIDNTKKIITQSAENSVLLDNEENTKEFTDVKKANSDLTPPPQSVSQSHNSDVEATTSHLSDSQGNKIVKKIIFFYGDNTFETFLPAEN